jgi:uncharacterized Rossmann fold enzyme
MTATAVKHLDVATKHAVQYCIPLWLRDEQIARATARVKGRIEEGPERADPVAVVCFGPSLAETWEHVRGFRYIITCSGAHKFLLEHGIVPTWHVEVDPRPHKVKLLGTPHPDVTYLPASTCHGDYFDVLEAHRATVLLWHVFDATEEAERVLPPGEWALTGGSSAGLRALTIARFLGFSNLHIFGMDGSMAATGSHAAEHPNAPPGYSLTTYDGVEYRTTPSMLECAKQTFHELDQLGTIAATFYGEGLVQAMAKAWTPKVADRPLFIGKRKKELISASYRAQNQQLHEANLAYGVGGGKHAPVVVKLCEALKTRSVLDYGCGKGYLQKALDFPIWEYDPAIPGKDQTPRAADLVVCTDVLEHIEPDKLGYVLGDLQRCVKKVGYFVVHTGPASKTLPDGRNTHLIQRDAQWWRATLSKVFKVGQMKQRGPEAHFVVGVRER